MHRKTFGSSSFVKALMLGIFAALLWAPAGHASFFQRLKSSRFWPGHWPKTVIVTGNYAKPRLLAEIAQRETNLPIILISSEETGDEVYYMPPPPRARRVQPQKFVELIDVFLRPKRVIFLGDSEYIPASYQKQVQGKYPTIVISGKDWIKNAEELGSLINARRLDSKYRQGLIKLLEAEASDVAGGELGAGDELMMPSIEDFEY